MKRLISIIGGIFFICVSYGFSQIEKEKFISFDNMDTSAGWAIDMDKGVKGDIIVEKGKLGDAVGINYELGNGNWIQIHKNYNIDFSKMENFYFDIKTEGAVNNIEIKFVDADGSNYGTVLKNFTTQNNWRRIKLSKSDFQYLWGGSNNDMDWSKVSSIWLAVSKAQGGEGKVLFDNIEYKNKEELLKLEGVSTKLMIDNFERSDPYEVYMPELNDKSDLNLKSVFSYSVEGNYSMELYYKLSTDKSIPSSVSAFYKFRRALNWKNVTKINLWVKGDSSRNVFSIEIVDETSEVWKYNDYSVLYDNKWKLLSIPMDKFKLSEKGKINNKIFDKKSILGVKFTIEGKSTEDSKGKVYVDKFYVVGKNLRPDEVMPEAVKRPIILKREQGNVDVKGTGFGEYKWTPEEGYNLFGYVKLKFDAKIKNFGVYAELLTENVEFGKSTYVEEKNGQTYLRANNPTIEVSSIQLNITDPTFFISDITIGNLFEDFSDYTYSLYHTDYGEWGYKGIKLQGGIMNLNYRLMYLKQIFDSYVAAGELTAYLPYFYLKGIYVLNNNRGHIPHTGRVVDTTIDPTQSGDFQSRQVFKEKTYTVEIGQDFLEQKLHLDFIAGENYYKQYGEAEVQISDNEIQDYIYNYDLPVPVVKVGQLFKLEVQARDLFLKYLDIYLNLRDIDNNYKPQYRKKPQLFDELYAGEYGGNLRVSQGVKGWVLSGETDILFRKISSQYFRKWFRYGVSKYGLYNFDLSLYQELKYQNDKYYTGINDDVIIKNENICSYIFQIIFHPISNLRIFEEQRLEYIKHTDTGEKFKSLRFYGLIEYYVSYNAKLKFEGVWFKYGSQYWEPHTEPYDDNFYRISLEVNF